ncbi:MAG: GntR family transcriptional regulator [Sphaerochaeta sp.]|jgi:DNA-binding LacI/PurR family transcriptional regulator|nr:GntR family transcriptional regulator [Sphaerochaeta sp.]
MQLKSDLIYQEVLARIKEGFWKPGEQIFSERQLSNLFGVSRVTVRNAISQLVGEGILEYREGRSGTFVVETAEFGPNPDARVVGIALDNYTPAFASYLLEGLHDALWKHNIHTLYCNTHSNHEEVPRKIASFIEEGVVGLIYSPLLCAGSNRYDEEVFALAKGAGVPLVQLDRSVSGAPFSCVQCDNSRAMYEMMGRLEAAGVSHPLVLVGIDTSSTEERVAGIDRWADEGNHSYGVLLIDEPAYYEDGTVRLLKEEPQWEQYDAIVGVNQVLSKVAVRLKDLHSLAVLTGGINASPLEVNNDYSVIQPLYHIGYSAALLLIQHLQVPSTPRTSVWVQASQWPNGSPLR